MEFLVISPFSRFLVEVLFLILNVYEIVWLINIVDIWFISTLVFIWYMLAILLLVTPTWFQYASFTYLLILYFILRVSDIIALYFSNFYLLSIFTCYLIILLYHRDLLTMFLCFIF